MNNSQNYDPNQQYPAQPQQNPAPAYGYTQPQQPNPGGYGQPAQYGQQPVFSPYQQPMHGGQPPIVPKKKNKFSLAIVFALISVVVLLINIFTGSFPAFFASETPTPELLEVNNMQASIGKYVTLDINYCLGTFASISSDGINVLSQESAVAQFDYANPGDEFVFGVHTDAEDFPSYNNWADSWVNAWQSTWKNDIGTTDDFFSVPRHWADAWSTGYYKEWGKYASFLNKLPTYTITGYLMEMDSQTSGSFGRVLGELSVPPDNLKNYIIKENYISETEKMEAYVTRVKSEKRKATGWIISLAVLVAITVLLLIFAVLKKDKPTPAMATTYPGTQYGAPTYTDAQYGASPGPYVPAEQAPRPYEAAAPTYTAPVAPIKPADTQEANGNNSPYPPSSPVV